MLGKLIKARVTLLYVDKSEDAVDKIPELNSLNNGQVELTCLIFDEQYLYRDGFYAFHLLRELRKVTGKFWFIFGAFESFNGLRAHIVLPSEQVPEKFVIKKWRFEECLQEIQMI